MLHPNRVSDRSPSTAPRVRTISLGAVYCLIAALGYGAVNICLRVLTVRCDRALILLSKETLALGCVAIWVIWGMRRRRFSLPTWSVAVGLLVVGILTQVGATAPLLWAMAVVGLAIAVTGSLCASLVTSAVLGRFVLGERVSGKTLTAIGLLVGSVAVLTFGAEGPVQSQPSAGPHSPATLLLATALACLAGTIYGLLNVSIRRSVTSGVSPGFVALVIPLTGVLCLGPACLWRLGAEGILATPTEDLLVMLLAGIVNVVAWFAFIKGLQTTPVVHANAFTASQVAMAAIAGVCFFEEALTPALLAGIAMTIAGMVWIDRPT